MRPAATASALVLVIAASLLAPTSTLARDKLDNGDVDPEEGTTSDVFTFSVEWQGDGPADLPEHVYAMVGDIQVPMQPDSPLPVGPDVTYVGSSTLPEAGTWRVTFHAEPGGHEHRGPEVEVHEAQTPTPSPTPRPTSTPTPTPTPTPLPTPTPAPTPTPTPMETPGGGVFTPAPTPTPTPTPTVEPSASAVPASASGSGTIGFVPLVMLFAGGTIAGSSLAFLGVYWLGNRELNAAFARRWSHLWRALRR